MQKIDFKVDDFINYCDYKIYKLTGRKVPYLEMIVVE